MSERSLLFLMTAEQAEAFAGLVEAAGRGDGGAACRLGDMYREGLGGLRYSPKETYRWYAKSALSGDANGQNNLGACYEHGLGCAQSYAKAVKWYRLSVAQKLGTASMNLGYCYLRGHGVPADKEEALRLFREAVERGENKAAQEVERLEGTHVYGRIPKVFKDRTSEGTGLALVGGVAPLGRPEGSTDPSKIRLVDETQPGKRLGLIGVSGVTPPKETDTARSDEATEDELFPIFAEGGLKPDDLVDGVAERYAEYLNEHPTRAE